MNKMIKLFLLTFAASAMVACSTTSDQVVDESVPEEVIEETVVEETVEAQPEASTETEASTAGTDSLATFSRSAINDPSSPLNQKIIYFDFDQSSILPEYMEVVNNHAQYLSDYPDIKVRLEGHADERGSREYNIALGERRAESVRRLLLLQGVGANQVSMISYGEELPAALAHDEESWALNRRVELVYEAQ